MAFCQFNLQCPHQITSEGIEKKFSPWQGSRAQNQIITPHSVAVVTSLLASTAKMEKTKHGDHLVGWLYSKGWARNTVLTSETKGYIFWNFCFCFPDQSGQRARAFLPCLPCLPVMWMAMFGEATAIYYLWRDAHDDKRQVSKDETIN